MVAASLAAARGSGRMRQPRGRGALYQRECRVIASREQAGEVAALPWPLTGDHAPPSQSTMRVCAPTCPATPLITGEPAGVEARCLKADENAGVGQRPHLTRDQA